MTDNIAAIATAHGLGAISIIRCSGSSVISEINKVFKGKNLFNLNANSFTHGYIINPENNEIIDDVICLIFKEGKSFTGEDSIEINCHGGTLITEKVLETILNYTNIKLAKPGEFSKRAFLNGKLDLIQAESIMSLIHAETEKQLEVAKNALTKKTSNELKKNADNLLKIISIIETDIDYPEYDEVKVLAKSIESSLINVIDKLKLAYQKSKTTKLINDGFNVVLIGKPNSGKSSILNRLIGKKRAIVSDIEGTTRDVISETINLEGFKIKINDTAGIRDSLDEIEKIGVKKTFDEIKKASLVLFVRDNNNHDYTNIISKIKNKNYIIINNKTDLLKQNKFVNTDNEVFISALKNKGIDSLKKLILKKLNILNLSSSDYSNLFTDRQINKIKLVINDLNSALKELNNNAPSVIISQMLLSAYENLLLILGLKYEDNLEKEIFKNFCLGK